MGILKLAEDEYGATVLINRHELPPHDVVDRVRIGGPKELRDLGESLIDLADAKEALAEWASGREQPKG